MAITVDDLHQHHKHHRVITYGIIAFLIVLSVTIISLSKSLETASVGDTRSQAASEKDLSSLTSLKNFDFSCYRKYCSQFGNMDALSCYKRYCQSNVTPTQKPPKPTPTLLPLPTNIPNGGFEQWDATGTNLLNWVIDSSGTYSQSTDHTSGSYSIQLPAILNNPQTFFIILSNWFTLAPKSYLMSFNSKALGNVGYGQRLTVSLVGTPLPDGQNRQMFCYFDSLQVTNDWKSYSQSCTIPPNYRYFEVTINTANTGQPNDTPAILIDDVNLVAQ